MSNSPELGGYKAAMSLEYKRFMEAMGDASENLSKELLDSLAAEEIEHSTMSKVGNVWSVVQILSSMAWEGYLINGLGEMLVPYRLDSNHNLIDKSANERSQLETFTSSLRAMLTLVPNSYVLQKFLSSFGLDALKIRLTKVIGAVLSVLKHVESTSAWTERYISHLEHGAWLAMTYTNACDDDEELVTVEELYGDTRVRTYAMLKTIDCTPGRIAEFLDEVGMLFTGIISLVGVWEKVYASMDPDDFEYVFNALTTKKVCTPYGDTKFENVHELNEYFRQRTKESIEDADGFIYNTITLLEETRDLYLDKFATDVLDLVVFLPSKKEQKRFIKQFESGRVWQE